MDNTGNDLTDRVKLLELSNDQLRELMKLMNLYHKEAERCQTVGASLAGCVMVGAALEAELTAMCCCFSDDIPSELIPRRRGHPQPLLRWSLSDLLRVARELRWLPYEPELGVASKYRGKDIGDYATGINEMRNLVHVGNYVRQFARQKVTVHSLGLTLEILQVASEHLQAKLHNSLREALGIGTKRTKTGPTAARLRQNLGGKC